MKNIHTNQFAMNLEWHVQNNWRFDWKYIIDDLVVQKCVAPVQYLSILVSFCQIMVVIYNSYLTLFTFYSFNNTSSRILYSKPKQRREIYVNERVEFPVESSIRRELDHAYHLDLHLLVYRVRNVQYQGVPTGSANRDIPILD